MHLALYRKYRPRTFTEVISQPHITTTLQNQIKSGQIAHAYLFMGSRGTGKTSCAKILAKAVNCLATQDGNPCLTCENCKIADSSPDIQELDAASNSGVDDVRALREEAGYLPSELKYRVYILDEVHAFSPNAWQALLKILEEPPHHVVFILATTEIHKVPATILSRCQRYEFHRINSESSAAALVAVAEKEGFALEKEAALLIARLSDGGMRDALSLLDVAASEKPSESGGTPLEGGDVITQEIVRDCAGIAGKEHVFAITEAVAAKDGKTALAIAAGLYAKSKDPTRLIDELLQHFRNLMIVKLMPGDFSLVTALSEEQGDYIRQAELFSLEAILDVLDKLEDCLRIKGRRVEAEICLMRLCVGSVGVSGIPPSVGNVGVSTPPPSVGNVGVSGTSRPTEPPPPPEISMPPEPPPPPEPISRPEGDFGNWAAILERLDAFKASMLEEASAGISGTTIVISGGEVLALQFENADFRGAIERAAREATGTDYKVVFNRVDDPDTPPFDVAPTPPPPPTPISPEIPQSVPPINKFLADVESAGIQITKN
jgi:DNA polymerase-3 subunit gamma/tau